MPSDSIRFSQLRWLHNAACVVSMIGSFVLMGFGLMEPDLRMIAAGGLWLFLAIVQMTVMPLLVKMEATLARQVGEVRELQKTISKYAEKLDAIAENTTISDAAKSLAHREQEIEAFRAAIRDDVRLEKW